MIDLNLLLQELSLTRLTLGTAAAVGPLRNQVIGYIWSWDQDKIHRICFKTPKFSLIICKWQKPFSYSHDFTAELYVILVAVKMTSSVQSRLNVSHPVVRLAIRSGGWTWVGRPGNQGSLHPGLECLRSDMKPSMSMLWNGQCCHQLPSYFHFVVT